MALNDLKKRKGDTGDGQAGFPHQTGHSPAVFTAAQGCFVPASTPSCCVWPSVFRLDHVQIKGCVTRKRLKGDHPPIPYSLSFFNFLSFYLCPSSCFVSLAISFSFSFSLSPHLPLSLLLSLPLLTPPFFPHLLPFPFHLSVVLHSPTVPPFNFICPFSSYVRQTGISWLYSHSLTQAEDPGVILRVALR